MRATVEVGEEDVTRTEQVYVGRIFKKYEAQTFTSHYHIVTTQLDLTEEERAVILKYELQNQVLDEYPRWTAEELQGIYDRSVANNENLQSRNDALRQMAQESIDGSIDTMRNERVKTLVGDLLQNPHKLQFTKPFHAATYADRMKTKILPELSGLLKKHAVAPKSETLEF